MARSVISGKARILIVDDEEMTRSVIKALLERQGYTTFTANDGVEASEFLAANQVEVMITDVCMPRKNGLQLLAEVRQSHPRLPVIIITAGPQVEAAVECMRSGAFDYLPKPFEVNKLNERVAKAVEQRRELDCADTHRFVNLNARRFFGNYRVVSVLGEGSVGIVFLAQSTRPDEGNCYYALKVLKPALTSEPLFETTLTQRFWHEAKAASEVRHPNIIAIREFGLTEDEKIPYLVMEFFDGRPLKYYAVNKNLLNYNQKINILRQVADALGAIHAKGITHRDIKPHNILVNDQLLVKITDFGIARIPDSDLTASTELMGSPAYLAPEAFETANVDARADIFSLGVVAYELFLGKRPFEADTIPRFAWLVQHERPTAPGQLDPEFPKPLQAMIARMLRKDLAARYPTAKEIVADFDRYLAGQHLSLPDSQVRRGGMARDWQ